jgi:hypothetical protein
LEASAVAAQNSVSGSSVTGGTNNIASNQFATVIGGEVNEADSEFSIRPQPPFP